MPDTPPVLTATAQRLNVHLEWTAASYDADVVTGYDVHLDNRVWNSFDASTTSVDVSTDHLGSHDYWIEAKADNSDNLVSNTETVTAQTIDAPTGLMTTLDGDGRTTLTWTAPDEGEAEFIIFKDGVNYFETGSTATTLAIDGFGDLSPGSYQVAAANDNGDAGDLSDPVTVTLAGTGGGSGALMSVFGSGFAL